MKKEIKTPTLDKMLKNKEASQTIGEFLEWVFSEKKLSLMYHEPESIEYYDKDFEHECEAMSTPEARAHRFNNTEKWGYRGGWMRHNDNIEQMLADYFGIDLKEAEKEKREILKSLQA